MFFTWSSPLPSGLQISMFWGFGGLGCVCVGVALFVVMVMAFPLPAAPRPHPHPSSPPHIVCECPDILKQGREGVVGVIHPCTSLLTQIYLHNDWYCYNNIDKSSHTGLQPNCLYKVQELTKGKSRKDLCNSFNKIMILSNLFYF